MLGTLGWTLARIEDAWGFLDPPAIEQIDDPRILTDYRSPASPIVDMVPLGFDTIVGRVDGTVHRYNMRTELFAEEQLPGAPTLAGPLAFLSSTCTEVAECPADATVFAVTETGGLAARTDRGWRTLISDSTWVGADGAPVDLSDVSLWTLSDDERWLLASAGAKGLGLFDLRLSIWVPVSQVGTVTDPEHLNFGLGRLWLGGRGGLETIDPSRPQQRAAVPDAASVLDLERAADGNLLVLQSTPCSGGTCLSISETRGPTDLRRLVGETSISPGLSATSLSHAALQSGRIVVLGTAGVHVYDPQARGWTVLEGGPVDTFHAGPEGQTIHYAAGSSVGRVVGGRVVWRADSPDRVMQLLPGEGDAVLALLRNGSVVDLGQRVPVEIVPSDVGPGDPSGFVAVAATRGTVVMRRGDDLILHDPLARRWSLQTQALPPSIGPRARLLGTENTLWLVDQASGHVFEGVVSGAWPNRSVTFRDAAQSLGRLVSVQANGNDLHLVKADGQPLRLQAGGGSAEVRVGAPAPWGFRPVTGAATADAMIFFSDGQRIAVYDTDDRSWSDAWEGPPGGVRDIDLAAGSLLALSQTGVLYSLEDDGWVTVAGSPGGLALGSDEVTDALQAGASIFMGGSGQVVEYRPDDRRAVRTFGGGSGEVRLAGVSNSLPVWASGGLLFHGNRQVSEFGERVLWAGQGPEGFIYLAEQNGRRHVVLPGQARQCLFRGVPAPSGTVIEARGLSDGRVFVATTEGMAIHEPEYRRWVRLQGRGVSPAARVEIVAGYLVVIEGAAARAVPLADLPTPDSCDTDVAEVPWSALPSAFQVVHEPEGDRLLLLGRDGSVQEWRGSSQRLLPAPGAAPTMASLRRVRVVPDGLVFAAADRIWAYDGKDRTWLTRSIDGGPESVSVLDIGVEQGLTRITFWDQSGQGYGGESVSGPIVMRGLLAPKMPRPAQDPSGILDMAQGDTVVTILGQRELELFERTDLAQRAAVRLPAAVRGWEMARVDGTGALVLTDGSPDAPLRMFVLELSAAQAAGTADLAQVSLTYDPSDDRDWRIAPDALWRIDRDLVLHHCEIAPGRSVPANCRAVTPPPEPLDPDSLIAAEVLPGGDRLVLSDGNVLRIDSSLRVSERISIPGTSPDARFVREGQAVVLWTGREGDLWYFPDVGGVEQVLDNVLDLRRGTGWLAATTPDGLRLITDSGAVEQPQAGALALGAATMDARGVVRGLGPDGRLRQQGQTEDPVSDVVLSEDVLAVAEGPPPEGADLSFPRAIWAHHEDGQVRVHWIGVCYPPEPVVAAEQSARMESLESASDAVVDQESNVDRVPQVPEAPPDGTPEGVEDRVQQEGRAPRDGAETEGDGQEAAAGAAEPGPIPCSQVMDTGLSLEKGERLLEVREQAGGTSVLTTIASHEMTAGLLHDARQADWSSGVPGNETALAEIRGAIVRVDGRPYLAPPNLSGSGGQFEVDRGAGAAQSVAGGKLAPAEAFSLSWMAWDRASRTVRFGESHSLSPSEAIHGGRFLPDVPGRAAYLGGDSFALLNPHGLWSMRIGLEALPISLDRFDLPQDLAGGRFLFGTNGIEAQTGSGVTDIGQETVTLGALRVTETLRGGGLQATLLVGGSSVSALGAEGFLFDQRLGIAAEGGKGLLMTPIGLVPLEGFGAGIDLPPGATVVDTEGPALMARGPAGWSRRTAQGWTDSAPPWHDRLLAEATARRWERRAGVFQIVPVAPGDAFAVEGQGLDFATDQLRALAAYSAGIVAVTGTGTHEASSFAALAALSPPATPDPGARALDVRDVVPGSPVLWAETVQGPRVWDRGARVWRAAGQDEDAWAVRTAVDSGDLRISFRQGRAEPSMRFEDLSGVQRHVAFRWAAGQDMPFERVRGFVVESDRILLATEMGLRRLVWTGQGDAASWLYSGVTPGAAPLAFDRVGRPASDPSRLLATAGASCFELSSADGAPVPCTTPGTPNELAVLSDPVWEWRKTDTDITGTYLDHLGQPIGPARLRDDGYWPHDRLRRVAGCSGTVLEVWAEADVVGQGTAGLPGQLQVLPGVAEVHCQSNPADLGQGERLAPGFLAAGGGTAWRLSGQHWQPERHTAEILERAGGGMPWEGSRLRLRFLDPGVALEVRGLDDLWRRLDWDTDRPAIDRVAGIAEAGPVLRLLTPEGVLDWTISARGLDPDTLVLRTPDDRGAFLDCRPARIEARDGSVQAVPRASGDPVDILCEDGRIWRGNPASTLDAGVFAPAQSDIGADRVVVLDGDWVWTRRVSASGAEALSIAFRNEAVSLDGGRLSLDDYTGLAAPFLDGVDIVTQAAGWWRSPRRDLSLTAARRPTAGAGAETATALHTDAEDRSPRLCVQGRDAVLVNPSGGVSRSTGCRDVRGRDATYTWYVGPDGAGAEGTALNGLPLRRNLIEGRFGDLFVIGAPMLGERGRILAPTRAGVIEIGPEGPAGTYARPDQGFLTADLAGLPVALDVAGAMSLGGGDQPACTALASLPAQLPEGNRVLRVYPVAMDAVKALIVNSQGERLTLLVPCASLQDTLAWVLPLDVRARARYRALGTGALDPRLLASVNGSRIFITDTSGRGVPLGELMAGPPVALVAAPDARSLVVATDRALYRIDMDRVIDEIGSRQLADQIPAPSGPFAPRAESEPDPDDRASDHQPYAPRVELAPVREGDIAVPSQIPESTLVLDDTIPIELDRADWQQVQEVLGAKGFYTARIDGIAGPRTRAAIREWQEQTGRNVTGFLTERQKFDLLAGTDE
ncbi:MAG: peptidoglycan-binding protein [Rubellimicrobium sp.]|nr:peptidoglycan-binding protein [Rubellimicrobium sp.]